MKPAALLRRFGTGDYTVTRRASPVFDADGVASAGSSSSFKTGHACLQPASGRTLQVAPEGLHGQDLRDLWTTVELRATPVPDVVTIGGEAWAVFHVEAWPGLHGKPHWLASLSRQVTP